MKSKLQCYDIYNTCYNAVKYTLVLPIDTWQHSAWVRQSEPLAERINNFKSKPRFPCIKRDVVYARTLQTQSLPRSKHTPSVIKTAVIRSVVCLTTHSLFQREFSTQCRLGLPLSISCTPSFPFGHSVAAYVFLLYFTSLFLPLSFLQ